MKYIGKRMPQNDSFGFVTGRTQYVNDIDLPGMLTVKALRSSVASAEIVSIDTTEAEKMPGVAAVITAKDVPRNAFGIMYAQDEVVLADGEVRFRGQPIAAVAAIDEKTAVQAIKAIKVEYKEREAVFDPEEAMKNNCLVRPEGNIWYFDAAHDSRKLRLGDIEAGFAEADEIVESDYFVQPAKTGMLENNCSVVDIDEAGRFNIYSLSQMVYGHLAILAGILQVPFNQVNMINMQTGGAFGGRAGISADPITAVLAMKTKRPCKWTWTREEDMGSNQIRGAWLYHIKAGIKKDGKITAFESRIIHDTGAYTGLGPYCTEKCAFTITGPYDIPNISVDAYCVYTNKPASAAMRGFGVNVGQFALEAHIDKLAEAVGLTPWDVRFRNSWTESSSTPTQQKLHDVAMIEVMQKCAELAGVDLPEEYTEMSSKEA